MNFASASSREKPKVVCVRSLVPKQKKSACWAISSATMQARGSSSMVPTGNVEFNALLSGNLGDHALNDLARLDMLDRNGDKRDHDLGTRVDAFLDEAGGSRGDGANLHERQVAKDDGQAHAAQAQHGVGLNHAIDAAQTGAQGGELLLGSASGLSW